MKTLDRINEKGNNLGIYANKCPNYNPLCKDIAPKYELIFEGTPAADVLGQSSYMSGNIKDLKEDFNEVYGLCYVS